MIFNKGLRRNTNKLQQLLRKMLIIAVPYRVRIKRLKRFLLKIVLSNSLQDRNRGADAENRHGNGAGEGVEIMPISEGSYEN